jgi:hypothetical protein
MDELGSLMAASNNPANERTHMTTPMHSEVALTAEDRQAARLFGHDLEEVLAWKTKQLERKQFEQPGLVALSGLPGTVELTAADIKVARMFGHDLEEVLRWKHAQAAKREHERIFGY